jgi:prephenate dehydratase
LKFDENKTYISSFLFSVKNTPGSLFKVMGGFATNNVNMIKLESYMLGGSFEATQFFADIQGHPEDSSVKRALDELKYFTNKLEIIGVYKQSTFRDKYS